MQHLRVARLGAALAAGCLALSLVVSPAGAAPKDVDYFALGDSYSFGVGNGFVSYADKLDAKKYVDGHKLAYPAGGTAVSVLAGQVPLVTGDADLLTITVGGNDVGWVQILQACAVSPSSCQGALYSASVTMNTTLRAQLDALFTSINSKAPGAKVVVLGYPHLFTPDPADPLTPVYVAVNAATDQLNAVIRAEAMGADGPGGADFVFVDVTHRFDGHGANSVDPWINPFPATSLVAVPLHPNAEGQQAYYAAVRSTGKLG